MGMFLNYDNIANNYTPNNIKCSFPVGKSYTKLQSLQASKPYEQYNAKGELIGYYWRYGETLNLEFNIDGEVTVEDTALILDKAGREPSNEEGNLMQRAYNIVDKRSWTCIRVVDGITTWDEDKEFTYPYYGKSIYLSAENFLADKQIDVTLYNFRMEPIHTEVFPGKTKIILNIDKELSSKLVRGIYYCSLTVFNDEVNLPIFTNSDCTLLVK